MSQHSPNDLKMLLLLGGVTLSMMFIGNLLGEKAGVGYALLLAFPINFGLYWFCDKLVLALYSAKEVGFLDSPALFGTVAYLAERAKITTPRIFLIEEDSPNAFSMGRSPNNATIVVTTGLLKLLDQDELAGVIAHEFGHILHRDTLTATVAASIGSAICLLLNMLQRALIVGPKTRAGKTKKWGAWVMPFFAPFLAVMIQLTLPRSREYLADEKAATLCENSTWLVNAFQKMEKANETTKLNNAELYPFTAPLFSINPLHNRQWSLLFSTHPPLDERIERLYLLSED